ncbi:MAG: lipopolysaccharide transport periplasmic protein LptA [Rubrivivax sp.]|jgi:lipopolysaccharide export system protein LptA
MPHLPTFLLRSLLAALALAGVGAAVADKADRHKAMVVEAERPGTIDLQRQVTVLNGNVTISQGTMVIRAETVELREGPDGFRSALALGAPGKPASYRQKREGLEETVEGSAERIEFDGRSETLRFVGNGAVRRLRAGVVADEITGALIVWDAAAEVFSVQGGQQSATNPGGRVRAVLAPRGEGGSATAPATPGTGAGTPPATLQPSRQLAPAPGASAPAGRRG